MTNKPILAACLAGATLLSLAGCDQSVPNPPPAGGTTGTALSGNPVDRLAENPTSLLGRSAARGRDAARQAEAAQAHTSGVAGEISGQAEALTLGGVELRAPTSWQKVPARMSMPGMQTQTFRIGPDQGSGETLVAVFSGIKGDVRSNADRWVQQVTGPGGAPAEAKITKHNANGLPVTLVASEGTYADMSGGAMPDFGFRGAIIEGPQGLVFVRMTGPADQVKANESDWRTMVLGAKKP